MKTVNQIGTRQDINVRQGATAGIYKLEVLDVNGAAVDLSNITPTGGIYDATGTTKLKDWAFDTTDAATGIILFSLSAEDTTALDCSKLDFPAKHTWIINLIWDDGSVVPAYYGDFRAIKGDGE